MKSVSIVIPNWNGADLLQSFLPSVMEAQKQYPDLAEIIGANNAGIIASGMMIAGTQGNIGDADLTS